MHSLPITKTRFRKRMFSSVLVTVCLSGLYAYLYNLKFGLIMVLALTLAAVLSFFTVRKSAGRLKGAVTLSRDILSKGETAEMVITVETEAPFFVPFLYMNITAGGQYDSADDIQIVASVWRGSPCIYKTSVSGSVWGGKRAGVSELYARDFLGLYEFVYDGLTALVCVRPELIESQNNALAAHLSNMLMLDDKEDITGDTPSAAAAPGYTHRPYAPPDMPNRINWKLFARLDKFMVREMEYLKNPSPVIILDPNGITDSSAYSPGSRYSGAPAEQRHDKQNPETVPAYRLLERVVEGMLSHINSMLHYGLMSSVYIYTDSIWNAYPAADKKDMEQLRETLARYAFVTQSPVTELPDTASDTVILFTCSADTAAAAHIDNAFIVCPAETGAASASGIWLINESYDITQG